VGLLCAGLRDSPQWNESSISPIGEQFPIGELCLPTNWQQRVAVAQNLNQKLWHG